MDKIGLIDSIGKLIEKELVRNLKLIKESSYGILSSEAKRKEIERFKAQRIGDEYHELSEGEIDVIIEYILLRKGIKVNERALNKFYREDER